MPRLASSAVGTIEVKTIEPVVHEDTQGLDHDPEGTGGTLSLGMLSTARDERLALTFDRQGRPYVDVGLDPSSIDVSGEGNRSASPLR
jgi:hypothetical protein